MDLGQVNRLVILVKTGCRYCDEAKNIVKDLISRDIITSTECTLVNIANGSDANRKRFTDAFATVPQVFINSQHVPGGYSNLNRLHQSGELDRLLS